jgi:hypothetical protein
MQVHRHLDWAVQHHLYAIMAPVTRGGSGAGGSVGGGNMGGYVPLATSRQDPADRAYQQELSRTAQLTAQDPELQRYENARVAAKTQEEMNSVRDMGMEMWAKANPKLAAKVQPGQSGFDRLFTNKQAKFPPQLLIL